MFRKLASVCLIGLAGCSVHGFEENFNNGSLSLAETRKDQNSVPKFYSLFLDSEGDVVAAYRRDDGGFDIRKEVTGFGLKGFRESMTGSSEFFDAPVNDLRSHIFKIVRDNGRGLYSLYTCVNTTNVGSIEELKITGPCIHRIGSGAYTCELDGCRENFVEGILSVNQSPDKKYIYIPSTDSKTNQRNF